MVLKTSTFRGETYTYAEPAEPGNYAFGGTILFTSNGCYPDFNVPIKLHDRQMDLEPIRTLGVHKTSIRLTIDLIPDVTVIVHREGEAVSLEGEQDEEETEAAEAAEVEQAPEEESEADVEAEVEAETEVSE